MSLNNDLGAVELPSKYAKAIVAILTAGVTVLLAAMTDNVVTLDEKLGIAAAIVTAVGVYLLPNLETGARKYTKALVALAGAGLQVLIPIATEGPITSGSWLLVLLALLGAVSVGIVPNAGTKPVE